VRCPKCHRFYPPEYLFCPYDGSSVVERIEVGSMQADPTRISNKVFAGRYRIRGFVGKGAMARVYLAEDELTGLPVAVKVLEDPYRSDPGVRERFHREARAASIIGHPSIVTVYAEGEREDGAPFLVMEFLLGETVGEYVRREGAMPVALAMSALRQAASALDAAHRVGIIHRDVKADNLFLLGEPGDPYELKVVDFGLSREAASNLTAAGVVMGTPATMAPEQILGEGVDPRTDVYALGMVMYAALTAREPFSERPFTSRSTQRSDEGEDEVATLAHHLWTAPEPLSKHRADLDPRIEQIVMKAIRKSPDERFQSMGELIEEMDTWERPGVTLVDPLPPDVPYTPKSTIGVFVKASLGRAIGKEGDG
jgi:serine/threonine-protein kinase